MSIDGYIDYQRREFCKDVKCPRQISLDRQQLGSDDFEKTRETCKTNCLYTAHQFHQWLINWIPTGKPVVFHARGNPLLNQFAGGGSTREFVVRPRSASNHKKYLIVRPG